MNKQLEEKLYNDFPDLFAQKDWPKTETCMCWGIDIGDGWYSILRNLCEAIKDYQLTSNWNLKPEDKKYYNIQFTQIKTKFGELRVYVDDNQKDPFIKGLIMFAEYMANKTCFYCGHAGAKEKNDNIATNSGPFAQKYTYKPATCVKCKGK